MNLLKTSIVGYLFRMKIKSKNFKSPSFPKKTKIKPHHTSRFAFNLSFLTKDSKYNLDSRGTTINNRVRLKFLERMYQLSQEDIVKVLGYNKKQGLEKIPEDEVKLRIHSGFKSSDPHKDDRYKECEDDYWVFRLGNLGRVLGKKNSNIFYVMSIDATFDQYDHGS